MIRAVSFLLGGAAGAIGGAALDHFATDAFADALARPVAVFAFIGVLGWCVIFIGGARREVR